MEKLRVLLADDEPDIVESIQFRLEEEGYEVITAADGLEALEKARKMEPDLIVLDVMMPKENGYRVARTIREEEAASGSKDNVPIILLTARNLEGDPEREQIFLNFSRVDVMMYKPFEMDDLLKRIHGLLDR